MKTSRISIKNRVHDLTEEQLSVKLETDESRCEKSQYDGITLGEFINQVIAPEDISLNGLYWLLVNAGLKWPFFEIEASFLVEYCRGYVIPVLDKESYEAITSAEDPLDPADLPELINISHPDSEDEWEDMMSAVSDIVDCRDNPRYTIELYTKSMSESGEELFAKGESFDGNEWTCADDKLCCNGDAAELEKYRRTGLTAEEVQQAADLFSETSLSVPEEIIGFVNRASYHCKKCADLDKQISNMKIELAGLSIELNQRLKGALIRRLHRERQNELDSLIKEAREYHLIESQADVQISEKASTIALNKVIVEVFEKCDFNLCQTRTLSRYPTTASLLSFIRETLDATKQICYGENDVRNAIYNAAHDLEEV